MSKDATTTTALERLRKALQDADQLAREGEAVDAYSDLSLAAHELLGDTERCPVCGSFDLGMWAEDGESDEADYWECHDCKAHGNISRDGGEVTLHGSRPVIGWCPDCGRDIGRVEDHAPGCECSHLGPKHPLIAPSPERTELLSRTAPEAEADVHAMTEDQVREELARQRAETDR